MLALLAALFVFVAVLLGSPIKSLLFIRLSIKGMLDPKPDDLKKINKILKDKSYPKVFTSIFLMILFIKIQSYVKSSINGKKPIKMINELLISVQRYHNKEVIKQRLAVLLSKYDSIFYNKIVLYESPKAQPVIDFLHNISKLKAEMPITLNGIEDKLILLIGNPIINPELSIHQVDKRVIDKLQWFFGPRQSFLQHIVQLVA